MPDQSAPDDWFPVRNGGRFKRSQVGQIDRLMTETTGQCAACGHPFTGRINARFCDRPECHKARAAQRQRDRRAGK